MIVHEGLVVAVQLHEAHGDEDAEHDLLGRPVGDDTQDAGQQQPPQRLHHLPVPAASLVSFVQELDLVVEIERSAVSNSTCTFTFTSSCRRGRRHGSGLCYSRSWFVAVRQLARTRAPRLGLPATCSSLLSLLLRANLVSVDVQQRAVQNQNAHGVHEDHRDSPAQTHTVACRVARDGVIVTQVGGDSGHDVVRVDVVTRKGAKDHRTHTGQHQVGDEQEHTDVASDHAAPMFSSYEDVQEEHKKENGDDDQRRDGREHDAIHVVEGCVALR